MATIYGESPEIQIDNSYWENGGIAVMSVGDGEGGTITGGSGDNEGEQETSARIKWSITVDADGNYLAGGITGATDDDSWMRTDSNSPFIHFTDQELANMAISDGNLGKVFIFWNDGDLEKVFTFMASAWAKTPNCVTGFAG